MSTRQKLRDIEQKKRLLVAKADLQRATFLMLANPVFRFVKVAELGFFAIKSYKTTRRREKD
ncbi:MAG: hypothetical protein RI556_01105 [Hydrogenovibrio sp.]|uniref:hypothetical protein n=1 Tax=Hydrogenovibrio sp. TaxID=2065821 RepID=UPI00287040FD|nr:hypothetical protein [Hydrogenovibrio sp.]MDR9497747.1 hypothetical protein [Hydrogenovibrio sp.]